MRFNKDVLDDNFYYPTDPIIDSWTGKEYQDRGDCWERRGDPDINTIATNYWLENSFNRISCCFNCRAIAVAYILRWKNKIISTK